MLSQAIRQTESGGNFTAKGKSGEFGAYQWMPGTWSKQATAAGIGDVSLEDATPAQQNQVAYTQIKSWKDAGYNVGQIASMWNAGAGAPNAYLTGNSGVNKQGVAYDTAQYAKKVAQNYQTLKTGGLVSPGGTASTAVGAGGQPNLSTVPKNGVAPLDLSQYQQANSGDQGPSAIQTIGGDIAQGNFGGAAVDTAKSLFNFAFPIVGDVVNDIQGKPDKSALQQLGDAGMSALWFLPFGDIAEGLGLGVKAGAEALGVGADAAKTAASVASTIGTGAATGYAGDVASNLSQGKTGAGAFTPGAGTLTGGALGAAGLGAGALYNKFLGEQNVVNDVTKAYNDASGATKTMAKDVTATASKGLDPNPEFLANAGIPPETKDVNGKVIFDTGADSNSQKTLNKRIGALSDLRDAAVEKSGATVNINDLRAGMHTEADNQFLGASRDAAHAHIDNEMDALSNDPKITQDENGNISAGDATKIKSYFQGNTNYDATRPSNITNANKMMAGVAKSSVEGAASKAGIPELGALNKMIQQHYDAIDFLNKLNGQTVKGGRLGGYFARATGAVVGSTLTGGGILGKALGAIGGEEAGGIVSKFMQKLSTGGPLSAAVLGRMAMEDPELVQKFAQYIGAEGGEKIAPMVAPAQKTAGELVTGALKKLPVRMGAATTLGTAR